MKIIYGSPSRGYAFTSPISASLLRFAIVGATGLQKPMFGACERSLEFVPGIDKIYGGRVLPGKPVEVPGFTLTERVDLAYEMAMSLVDLARELDDETLLGISGTATMRASEAKAYAKSYRSFGGFNGMRAGVMASSVAMLWCLGTNKPIERFAD